MFHNVLAIFDYSLIEENVPFIEQGIPNILNGKKVDDILKNLSIDPLDYILKELFLEETSVDEIVAHVRDELNSAIKSSKIHYVKLDSDSVQYFNADVLGNSAPGTGRKSTSIPSDTVIERIGDNLEVVCNNLAKIKIPTIYSMVEVEPGSGMHIFNIEYFVVKDSLFIYFHIESYPEV